MKLKKIFRGLKSHNAVLEKIFGLDYLLKRIKMRLNAKLKKFNQNVLKITLD